MANTKKNLRDMEEWGKTASDRDIQFHLLRVAVETRDKIETIRGIITFLFVLWIIGVVLFFIGISNSDTSTFG